MEDKNPALKSKKGGIDIPLLGVTILLVFVGLLAIYDASVVSAFRDFGDKLYYFKNQLIWAGIRSASPGFSNCASGFSFNTACGYRGLWRETLDKYRQ